MTTVIIQPDEADMPAYSKGETPPRQQRCTERRATDGGPVASPSPIRIVRVSGRPHTEGDAS